MKSYMITGLLLAALAAVAAPADRESLPPFQRLDAYSFFDQEPPNHTRLRGLVAQVFTPRRVEALRPQVESDAGDLLAAALRRGRFDLVEDYAAPLPVAVIADLLGIPPADRGRLRPWSAAIVAMYELRHTPAQEQAAGQAAGEFWDYLDWLANARRREPQDDLISALAAAMDAETGARLSQEELIAACILLLNAGHEATVNAFGNGMLALFQDWRARERLAADASPTNLRRAVEEMLRYNTPLQLFRRWVYADCDYAGQRLQAGQQVALFLGSANRDPERFERPDEFDITRSDNPHLAFGAGIHYCLGAPLARLELEIALGALLRLAPKLRLDGDPVRKPSFVIRGYQSIPVIEHQG